MNVRDLVPWSRGSDRDRRGAMQSSAMANPVMNLHREMNRLFDDMFRGFEGSRGSWPSMDVEETDKEYRVTAELPGLDEKDVEVILDDGVLSLRGEKKWETEPQNRSYSERVYGRFERQIVLGRDVDENAVSATFKNGVLTVTVAKSAQAAERQKKIPINTAAPTGTAPKGH